MAQRAVLPAMESTEAAQRPSRPSSTPGAPTSEAGEPRAPSEALPLLRRDLTVALAGQPNVGKSTIFNALTGLHQHVGNWPGKTIEQKTATLEFGSQRVHLVDLPGTYGLTARSPEEAVVRDYVLHTPPDVLIVVVNAASLERNLYLVAELLGLPLRLVIGLNMMDVAEQEGIRVDPAALEQSLKIPVIPIIAPRGAGLTELMQRALAAANGSAGSEGSLAQAGPVIRAPHREVLEEVRGLLTAADLNGMPPDWVALKLLEGEPEVTHQVLDSLPLALRERLQAILRQHEDAFLDIVGGRYEWILNAVRPAVRGSRTNQVSLTDRIDRIATHPILGMLLLLPVLGASFWLTYTLALPVVNAIGSGLSLLNSFVSSAMTGTPGWLVSLLNDGIIDGLGRVISFLPILIVFYAVFGLLEDVGYFARAAFVMDRFMHRIGLHGKSFLPLILGFGCNVPAVLGTRILGEKRARLLTTLLSPLVPCTARLAVLAFLAPAFFGAWSTLASLGLVALNLALLFVLGAVLDRYLPERESSAFILELPLYHLPNLRNLALLVWNSTEAFLSKAGRVIFAVALLIWLLSVVPRTGEASLLAIVGKMLIPIGASMGFGDWRIITALLTSFIAKENTIATLGVLFGHQAGANLASQVASVISPAGALAFLAVEMIFVPCAATVAVIRQEVGWKWATASILVQLGLALAVGVLVFQIAAFVH